MRARDWRLVAGLFILISSIYFATVAGITSSNDGSHYALVRALVDKHSFEISDYIEYTENLDYSFKGAYRFSDRPPGTAFLAAPLYAASAFLPKPLVPLPSKHDLDNPRLIYVLMLPVLAASLTVVILFWILRAQFELNEWASVLTILAFAFGTMTWKYGSLLYSHATSGLVVMLAVALLLKHLRSDDSMPHSAGASRAPAGSLRNFDFWLGALVGTSVLMEYTNIVFVGGVGVWYVWRIFKWPGSRQRIVWFVSGGLVPAALLMGYNTVNFGGPLQLSTFNVDTSQWPQNASFFHDFATPIWVGLPAMLFYSSDNQGLFWLAPVALLGLLGLRPLWRRSKREFMLIVGVFVVMLLLFSTSTTFNPLTNDGRYLAPFLGLWFVAVGLGTGYVAEKWGANSLAIGLVYGLFFLSIYNQILHIAYSWGHDLNPATLRPWAAAPENIVALWRAVLPNALNLPLWWGVLIIGWIVLRWSHAALGRRGRVAQAETPRPNAAD